MKNVDRISIPIIASILLLAIAWTGESISSERRPLLQEGKKSIYQRVLTRPGAVLVKQPGMTGRQIPVFTRYYVYARKQVERDVWLEIGANHQGKTIGWTEEKLTVPWKQQLALSFSNPAGRKRVIFFDKRKDLESILESETPSDEVAPIYESLASDRVDKRIISIEPKTHIDIKDNFYLLPIIESEEIYTGIGRTARLLKIASVTKQERFQTANQLVANNNIETDYLQQFSSALVFVIDSTISMEPYIERTKEAVSRIYKHIEVSGLLDKVKFGLVAYRADNKALPDLDYLTKIYADPTNVKDGADFLRQVGDLKSAHISTGKQFDEDAYAGVMAALNDIAWENYGARYIVLVTDAGALRSDEALSTTGLNAQQVRMEASYRGVALYSLHLKTPAGKKKKNHKSAQIQYESLSFHPVLSRPLYYPIEVGDVGEYGSIIDRLADTIVNHVKLASQGKLVDGSTQISDSVSTHRKVNIKNDTERLRQDTMLLGYAMQLEYLGRKASTEAPSVLQGWITDIDLDDPLMTAVEVRVLLTKNQLSDIQLVLRGILDASEQGLLAPENFFDSLRSFAARIGRDPNRITSKQTTRLADLGLLEEYLEGLPYKSDLMHLDQDTWSSWGHHKQIAFINTIRRKMRLYEIYNEDSDRWVSLVSESHPSEHVYPIPIDALP